MNRRARIGLSMLGLALVLTAGLGVSGVVRIPWLSPGATIGPEADRPDELDVADAGPGRELAGQGGRSKPTRPAEAAIEAPVEPALPSEATGTAIGKVGGSIRGRVVDVESKRPVAGATVELLMPEALFHYLRASPVGRFDRLTVMTDGEGRFAMNAVLPCTDYELRARKGTGPYATRRVETLSARESLDVGDIVIGPTGGLSGRVVGADGKGIADARVVVTWMIENDFDAVMADPDTLPWVEATVKTDAEGAWKAEGLEVGHKTLVVRAPNGAADVKASVLVVAGVVTPGIDWTLGGALGIAGRVEWADGKPIEGARVFAKTMAKPASFTAESMADGSFRLFGLSDGVYIVGAFVPGMSAQLAPGKKAGDENVRITVPIAGALTGRVVSKSTGKAIVQFKVTPVFADAQGWMQQMVAQKFDKVLGGAGFQSPEGMFRFDRLKSGHYTLHVEAEGYPPTDSPPIEVIAGAEAVAPAVEVPDGNRISGFVRDEAGHPIADAKIVLMEWKGMDTEEREFSEAEKRGWVQHLAEEARTDEKGAFMTTPLTPRRYELGAARKGRVPRTFGPLDVSAKSIDGIEFRLDRSGTAVVRVRSDRGVALSGVDVWLVDAEGASADVISESDGAITRDDLSPGRYVATEAKSSLYSTYREMRGKGTTWNGAAFFERVRGSPGAVEFTVVAGGRAEATLTVPSRSTISGRVRFGDRKQNSRWFALDRGDGERVYISVEEDGTFSESGVVVGRYSVFGLSSTTPAGTIDVPESGLKGIEIDLSK